MAAKSKKHGSSAGPKTQTGVRATTATVDANKLPEPAIVGFANRVAIAEHEDHWELFFYEQRAKERIPVARGVATLDTIVTHLIKQSEPFAREVRQALGPSLDTYSHVTADEDFASFGPAAQFNLFVVSRVGQAASMSTYYVTPFSFARKSRVGGELSVLPLFLVQCPTAMIVQLIETAVARRERLFERMAALAEHTAQ